MIKHNPNNNNNNKTQEQPLWKVAVKEMQEGDGEEARLSRLRAYSFLAEGSQAPRAPVEDAGKPAIINTPKV